MSSAGPKRRVTAAAGKPRTPAEKWREDLMRATLQLAVPLWLDERRAWPLGMLAARARECGAVLGPEGDVLMFTADRRGGTARVFNYLAEGMACALLVVDGGVEFLGVRWSLDGGRLRVGDAS